MAIDRLKTDFNVDEIQNAAMLLRRALSDAELDGVVDEKETVQGLEQLYKIEKKLVEVFKMA